MCVIIHKSYQSKMKIKEQKQLFQDSWENNSDGAGFAWHNDDNTWSYKKGYMKFKSFWRAFRRCNTQHNLDARTWIVHFRVTTAGLRKPEQTHPFPIVDDFKQMRKNTGTCAALLFHNGTVGIGSQAASDTMQRVKLLAPLFEHYIQDEEKYQELLEFLLESPSRWMLCYNNVVQKLGTWVKVYDHEHVWASTTTYKPIPKPKHTSGIQVYDPKTGKWKPKEHKYAGSLWPKTDDDTKTSGYLTKVDDTPLVKDKSIVNKSGGVRVHPNTMRILMQDIETEVLVDECGSVVWDKEFNPTLELSLLICPNCEERHLLMDSPFNKGDTICGKCGAVFSDTTGIIYFYARDRVNPDPEQKEQING